MPTAHWTAFKHNPDRIGATNREAHIPKKGNSVGTMESMQTGKRKPSAVIAELASQLEETTKRLELANKRQKLAINAINAAANFITCPISGKVPLEPVMAEDGRFYDRADIQTHIDNAENGTLRSPVSGAPMGSTLMPYVEIQNNLHALIDSGLVEGDAAERLEKLRLDIATKEAEAGDTAAMCRLSVWYFYGRNGLQKDEKLAYEWCSKAGDLFDVAGMAYQGLQLYKGFGVDKDEVAGVSLLHMAAYNGNAYACYLLGNEYFLGDSGLAKNDKKAKYWLRKAVELSQDDKKDSCALPEDKIVDDCKRMLRTLQGDSVITAQI
mmetsp:Transcript_20342/g.41488  ORF Transcript_20342/g.41488 Transcript_20342/m.41488 type:complete len:324 (-) Transcript_20342:594-1565(-)